MGSTVGVGGMPVFKATTFCFDDIRIEVIELISTRIIIIRTRIKLTQMRFTLLV
jgi:hypothetical protein